MGLNTLLNCIFPYLILGFAFADSNFDEVIEDIIFKNVPEDGRLNFTQMAKKYGQECEEHTVITEDGYKLTMFHLPGDKKKPVFLMHGIADSADTFMLRGNISLSITLARLKYDVWVGNVRGNKYARQHVTLDADKDKKEFWNFTMQELAVYDLPAMLDYVLNATDQTQLQAMGHSQGNAIFYVLGAEKPEYNDKLKLFIALAPICYLHHTRALAKVLIKTWPAVSTVSQLLGNQEIFTEELQNFKVLLCSQKEIGYEICAKGIFFPLAGSDPDQLEPEFFPILIGRYPSSSSIMNGNHLVQIAHRKKFAKYDYGFIRNFREYGSAAPPEYSLNKVTMPIALIAGENDNLSTLEDVELLKNQLPNLVKYHVVDRKKMNHLDYTVGRTMTEYLYPTLFDLLEEYS